jgi:hypothetical protein
MDNQDKSGYNRINPDILTRKTQKLRKSVRVLSLVHDVSRDYLPNYHPNVNVNLAYLGEI